MTPKDIYNDLKKNKIHPVYYLYGNDDFLKNESFKRIKQASLNKSTIDFNFDLFYGASADINTVISCALTLPVLSQRRLVVLKEADKIKSAGEEAILEYLENPSQTATLLIIGADIDKRKKLFTRLKKLGALVDHNRPYEREMPKWIHWIAKEKGVQISDEAANYLLDLTGNDLCAITNEIEKASLHAGEGNAIALSDIEAVSFDVKARTIFELIDAIGAKNLKKSLFNLGKLTGAGESPLMILSMILRQLRMIWIGVDILNSGGSEADVKQSVKLPPFLYRGFFAQVRLFSHSELKRAYRALVDLDIKFKSSPIMKENALELFLFDLCATHKKRPDGFV